ncbi:MAG: guanylate kinase [Eubacterium sp.]|nr:guanylate kinase [Eubacterium sp.]
MDKSKARRGLLIVISGPSGTGKGTVCGILKEKCPGLKFSVSETTRKPREKEVHGVNYFFVTKEEFEARIGQGQYLEHATVYENYYGTPKEYVENLRDQGYDVILEIDIQGADQVRANGGEGIFIFIAPPSLEELRKRIELRGTESPEQLELRMGCARNEMLRAVDYDYMVVNEVKETAAAEVMAIITAEHIKTERSKQRLDTILGR